MKSMTKLMKKQSGQGMTEYIIIVALIAIAAIGVITIFGDNIRALFGASVNALAGTATPNAKTAKATASEKHRGMKDFASQSTAAGADK